MYQFNICQFYQRFCLKMKCEKKEAILLFLLLCFDRQIDTFRPMIYSQVWISKLFQIGTICCSKTQPINLTSHHIAFFSCLLVGLSLLTLTKQTISNLSNLCLLFQFRSKTDSTYKILLVFSKSYSCEIQITSFGKRVYQYSLPIFIKSYIVIILSL